MENPDPSQYTQVENVTADEFDLLRAKGWIREDGTVTPAGKASIFGGGKQAAHTIYLKSEGVPNGGNTGAVPGVQHGAHETPGGPHSDVRRGDAPERTGLEGGPDGGAS